MTTAERLAPAPKRLAPTPKHTNRRYSMSLYYYLPYTHPEKLRYTRFPYCTVLYLSLSYRLKITPHTLQAATPV